MSKLLICIPVRNRMAIARECVPTVKAGAAGRDFIAVFNDGSDEPVPVEVMGDRLYTDPTMGIEAQRRRHFLYFRDMVEIGHPFTHLYLTDADALHDPKWRAIALGIQSVSLGAPVCLYNTAAHSRLVGNTIEQDVQNKIIYRRVAPGISYLLTADHVTKVVAALPHLPAHWNWDWTVPALLGHRMAISEMSYVDHLGFGGLHHPVEEGIDGGDRATNPTPWLVKKRAEVVEKLYREQV